MSFVSLGDTSANPAQTSASSQASVDASSNVTAADSTKKDEALDFASRFAKLTQKERDFHKSRLQFKTDKEELEEYRRLKSEAKNNPLEILKKFDLNYGDLTEQVLKPQNEDDKLLSLEQRIAKFEKEKEQSYLEKQENERKAAYDSGLSLIKNFVDQKGDDFELIRLKDAYADVFELALLLKEKKGETPAIEEVASLVEKHLEQELETLTKAKKLQLKYQQMDSKEGKTNAVNSINTLTNNAKTQSTPESEALDDKTLMQRAIATYRNSLTRK